MTEKKAELVEKLLKILIEKISRRTSESYAVLAVQTVLQKLISKYDFLKYIEVQRNYFSELSETVTVFPDLDSIDDTLIYKSINDIIKQIIQYLENNADYFFIREFQEALEKEKPNILNDINLDLHFLQLKYIVDRREELHRDNKEITERFILALSSVINKVLTEKKVIETLVQSFSSMRKKHDSLSLIDISNIPDSDGFYSFYVDQNIENVWQNDLAEALQDVIQDVVNAVEWTGKESFIDTFKRELGNHDLIKIKNIGLDLEKIHQKNKTKENEIILKKSLETLIQIIGEKTSVNFATLIIKKVVIDLEYKHEILQYVRIEHSLEKQLYDRIIISPKINTVDSSILGKVVQDIIKISGLNLGDKTQTFIQEFKDEIGEDYIKEFEKMGINLHLLELKFI